MKKGAMNYDIPLLLNQLKTCIQYGIVFFKSQGFSRFLKTIKYIKVMTKLRSKQWHIVKRHIGVEIVMSMK